MIKFGKLEIDMIGLVVIAMVTIFVMAMIVNIFQMVYGSC